MRTLSLLSVEPLPWQKPSHHFSPAFPTPPSNLIQPVLSAVVTQRREEGVSEVPMPTLPLL